VELGIVFKADDGKSNKELRDMKGDEERRKCILQAVKSVEDRRQMEGVLSVGGKRGHLGFLVYRED